MRTLHQLLHGYSDGHRQLAGSVRLESPQDLKRVLVFSDMSGPGRTITASGYITGYPLQESGYYALAKTWRAEEMSRPGCVWTHTLLIALADLAALTRPESLAGLFVRPAGVINQVIPPRALQAYSEPADVDFDGLPVQPALLATHAIAELVRALYLAPSTPVIAPRAQFEDPETTVLRIWGQQWPRLRRNFRFCSSVTVDRSSPSDPFDLQLLDGTHWGVRAIQAPSAMTDEVQGLSDRWLSVCLHDLLGHRPTGLSPYLRSIGSELQSGRAAFGPLLEIFALLASGDFTSVDAVLQVAIAHETSVASPKLTDLVVRFALAHGGPSTQDGWAFVAQNVTSKQLGALTDGELHVLAARLPASGWTADDLNDAATIDLMVKLVPHLTGEALASLSDAMIAEIVVMMPALASSDSFRMLPLERIEAILLQSVVKDLDLIGDILAAAVQVPSPGLASICSAAVDASTLLDTLSRRDHWPPLDPWLAYAVVDPNAVAIFLHSGQFISKEFLERIAETGEPESIPNAIGPDPWVSAIQDHLADLGPCLSAYLFARGFSGRTHSSDELMLVTFGQLHRHIATSRLATRHWQWLDRSLPPLDEYRGWDRCLRLRSAMATVILHRKMGLGDLLQLTDDDQVLILMVLALREQSGGKKFVRAILKESAGVAPDSLPRARWLRDATS